MLKKITVILTFVFLLVGCSTKRELKFNSGTGEFLSGKYSEKKVVEGSNIESYLPKIKEEYLPFFLGWVDEQGEYIDPKNISTKITTITIKWDEEKIVSYLKDKEASEIISVLSETVRKSNIDNDLEYDFGWESLNGRKYLVMNTLLIDEQLVSMLSDKKSRTRGREELNRIYKIMVNNEAIVRKKTFNKYPLVSRLTLDNEQKTVIYESIDNQISIDIMDLI